MVNRQGVLIERDVVSQFVLNPPSPSIIPCFNPGPPDSRTQQFRTITTSFVGSAVFEYLEAREIHFNESLRSTATEATDSEGGFPWSEKWPISENDATAVSC